MGAYTILVVDEEPDVRRRILEVVLDTRGHAVLGAGSGMEALVFARGESRGAIQLDPMMKWMGGREMLELILDVTETR
jgi:CheY-like chemotaxis protein